MDANAYNFNELKQILEHLKRFNTCTIRVSGIQH
jgi:hypothetical protein